MRTYGKVVPTFWTRGTGKRLRGDLEAQVVALYLMTCPAVNMIGIFHMSMPQLCSDTGLTLEGACKGLKRCEAEGFAHYDADDELVFVPGLAMHQVGEQLTAQGKNGKPDRRIAGVRRAIAAFKGHRFYDLFLDRYAAAYHLNDLIDEGAYKPLGRGYVPATAPDPVLLGGAGGDSREPAPPDSITVARSSEPKPEGEIPCPADLALPEQALATLEVGIGLERWAADVMTQRFVSRYLATPTDRRFRNQWLRGLNTALMSDWNNSAKRKQLRAEREQSEGNVDAAARARVERENRLLGRRDTPPDAPPPARTAARLDDFLAEGSE